MYNTPNQAIQQNSPYPRFQTVGPLDVSNNTMPVANRAVAAPLAPSQRQTTEWGMSFTGGDKKTLEMAEHVKMKVLPFYEIKKNVIKQRCLGKKKCEIYFYSKLNWSLSRRPCLLKHRIGFSQPVPGSRCGWKHNWILD